MSIELSVNRLAYGGDGISTLPNGKTIFIRGALPGDKVQVHIDEERSKFCKGHTESIIEASPNRVNALCPYADVCGGCPWQALEMQSQLQWKRKFVVDALSRIGKIEDAEALVANCIPSKKQWGYRNKIELVPVYENGKLRLGYHSVGSNQAVAIDKCMLLPKGLANAPKALAGSLRYLKASDYELKRVSIRTSVRTNSTQVGIWTAPGFFPRAAASNILNSALGHTSLVRVLVKGDIEARVPSKIEVLAGDNVWHEKLDDMLMSVSAPSFFQVNTRGAESLIALAMAGLQIEPSDVCCDLYCGTGTFTLPMAALCDDVVAVESVGSSVRDLRRNLKDNDLDAEVIGGDAVREARGLGKVDKLVIDPPYSGMGEQIFEGIKALDPTRIALVSCNPTTLARDLGKMIDIDYVIERVTPVDLFPQTFHVESVTVLHKKSAPHIATLH